MYKLNHFEGNRSEKFLELLKSNWDKLHNDTDIFRYKIDNFDERLVEEKYVLQLNPDRRAKRRTPEEMNDVCQPFDKNKFNFTKVSPEEILFSLEDDVSDVHTVIVNVSPISRYHSLLCPSVNKCLPQVVTAESLALAAEIMFVAQDRNLRILFNSLCAFASVNHLHYHLFIEEEDFYVENVKWQHVKGDIHRLDASYPVPAFCFKIKRQSIVQNSKEIYKVLEHFLNKSIAHNILLTTRSIDANNVVNVIVWPRKKTVGAKQFSAMNVAVLELSGWFPVYDAGSFTNLQAADLEKELSKWNIEDFDKLCEEIVQL
ncbi:GDP-D-glucose phosphorylase 1 [Anticarsia gemmatalis]|uniref:GDP-D-glucose phosphorylase 1 n=1 Tax=Anticarsia gemmatalis TaxID=129554 RepID=UPI003F7753D3